jgi:hypothetical protein
MKIFRLGLISRIALLVVCVELVAFSLLGWFYIDRFSRAIDERTYAHLRLVGRMIANDELAISSIARHSIMSDLTGAPYLNGMVIGGNGRVIVSSNSDDLGRLASSVPGFDTRWISDSAPEQTFIPVSNTLTAVMHSALNGSPMYTTVISVSTEELNANSARYCLSCSVPQLSFLSPSASSPSV